MARSKFWKILENKVQLRGPVGSIEGPWLILDPMEVSSSVTRVPSYDFRCLECKNIKDSQTSAWWGLSLSHPLNQYLIWKGSPYQKIENFKYVLNRVAKMSESCFFLPKIDFFTQILFSLHGNCIKRVQKMQHLVLFPKPSYWNQTFLSTAKFTFQNQEII